MKTLKTHTVPQRWLLHQVLTSAEKVNCIMCLHRTDKETLSTQLLAQDQTIFAVQRSEWERKWEERTQRFTGRNGYVYKAQSMFSFCLAQIVELQSPCQHFIGCWRISSLNGEDVNWELIMLHESFGFTLLYSLAVDFFFFSFFSFFAVTSFI